jgi:hypothetical protein
MRIPNRNRIKAGCFFTGLLLLLGGGICAFGNTVAISGAEIHTMNGRIWETGTILITDGKIVAVGRDVSVPEDAEIIEGGGHILYPGFIASSGLFAPGASENFESFSPDASAADRFDFYGDYIRFVRGGVTSAFVSMPADRIIPGKGVVVRLGSRGNLSSLLKEGAALNINLGREAVLPPMTDIFPAPVSIENPLVPSIKQFPSSSLGAFWLLAELFRPDPFTGELARYYQNAANSLKESLEAGLPLIVRCRESAEIRMAIRFARSVGMPLVLQGAEDVKEWIEILKENDIPVIAETDVAPNGQGHSRDFGEKEDRWSMTENIPALIRQGIRVAIVPMDEDGLPDLFWITQYFRRYGIDAEELIRTITLNPAKIFGLEDRIGSLSPGKDADILFFKREAGAVLPVLKKVMSQGLIVYEE